MKRLLTSVLILSSLFPSTGADRHSRGDAMLADYFAAETAALEARCLSDVETRADWDERKGRLREELFEMLSLSPRPERTDLKAVVTGRVSHEEFTVENLHFQSMPGFYVTGNLYIPREVREPLPAILYVSGHGPVVRNGISYGNKVSYQHHGAWFARNGYVCLTLDTVQMGEIEGIHHGTYREGMWWWNSRGYTSAGAEAWNVIRALDYLETRPEVDSKRFGITGRSGGGAYSWWGAALDDRIKAAAPVAGITDLHNHVVDGTVEGHCDCMFIVNTHRWDYAQVAALVAPRPLLIANTDKDSIFPLDGVVRLHSKVRRIYDLHEAGSKLGLLISEGPHKDTQDLQVPVFRWFNKHLKGEDPVIEMAAVKFFEPEQLKVFETLPSDERTSVIYETFIAEAEAPGLPLTPARWEVLREGWMAALRGKVFGGWPAEAAPVKPARVGEKRSGSLLWERHSFASQDRVELMLDRVGREGGSEALRLEVLDEVGWSEWERLRNAVFEGVGTEAERSAAAAELERKLTASGGSLVFFAPRGVGLTAWDPTPRKQIQNRRRFMLLGQTVDGMRVWDIRRALQALRAWDPAGRVAVTLGGEGEMGCNALYASLFETGVARVDLRALPGSHRTGPDYLNVLRFLDLPQAVAMAGERAEVTLRGVKEEDWSFPVRLGRVVVVGE